MDKEQTQVRVVDSSVTAEHPQRVHDVVVDGNIQRVVFNLGEEMLLPYAVGVKFMQEGFRVFEPGTNTEIIAPPKTDETIRTRIGPDEVVAKYTELTDAALRMRAASLVDGERFISAKVDQAEIIAFLKSNAVGTPEEDEDLIDEEETLVDVGAGEEPSADEDDQPINVNAPQVVETKAATEVAALAANSPAAAEILAKPLAEGAAETEVITKDDVGELPAGILSPAPATTLDAQLAAEAAEAEKVRQIKAEEVAAKENTVPVPQPVGPPATDGTTPEATEPEAAANTKDATATDTEG